MRLMDKNDFLDLFYVASAGQDKWFIKAVEMVVEDTPTIDAVPVVRCKDCKNRYDDSWCEYVDDDDNFYCARGERKDGEG